jgi:uncharacterized protein (DUF305 family)
MATEHHGSSENRQHYGQLVVMAAVSFAAMYVLMYAMVDALGNVYHNVNQVYMAGLMTAPMVVIELFVMRGMYHGTRTNAAIIAVSAIVGIACFFAIRQQAAVSDRQFLRSMIPHHASALLMCEQSPITDPEIQMLCKTIILGQQAEIDQMKAMLRRLD